MWNKAQSVPKIKTFKISMLTDCSLNRCTSGFTPQKNLYAFSYTQSKKRKVIRFAHTSHKKVCLQMEADFFIPEQNNAPRKSPTLRDRANPTTNLQRPKQDEKWGSISRSGIFPAGTEENDSMCMKTHAKCN
ncbi:MAG: hypothetical protein WCR47_09195 [Desulfoplanes sp.]